MARKKQKPRFPPRQKRSDGSWGCRGCGGEIPKGRLTWCSRDCVKKFDPFWVKHEVAKLYANRCAFCGKDCSKNAQWHYNQTVPKPPDYSRDCGLGYPYNYAAYKQHALYRAYESLRKEWAKSFPKPEYDHIIPHSEGGPYTVDNIRLLCRACHLKRTREWRESKKENRPS